MTSIQAQATHRAINDLVFAPTSNKNKEIISALKATIASQSYSQYWVDQANARLSK
jgi:hypothetical protein